MSLISKPINFLKEVKAQLIKVSWPTRQELISATVVVITITVFISLFIGLIDTIFSQGLTRIFS